MEAWWLGWWFGWGFSSTSIYWFAYALLTDPDKYAWVIPFAVLGIGAILACYSGLVVVFTYVSKTKGWYRILCFAALWSLGETARGSWFTGFPWNPLGLVLSSYDEVMQLASVIGVYGLGFIVAFTATIPSLIERPKELKSWLRYGIPVLVIILLVFGYGAFRLTHATQAYTNTLVRIVQPNILQHHKWEPSLRLKALERHIFLSQSKPLPDDAVVIWPETALTYDLKEDPWVQEIVQPAIPDNGFLLTGMVRIHDPSIWNSVVVLNSSAEIVTWYDKFHLVPFGEYIPLRSVLPSTITKLTYGAMDFSAGEGNRTLEANNLPSFSPLICYEAIFPSRAVDRNHRPHWILNITNDAWFGFSAGPYQHFEMVRYRAIEEGMPLIRAANTGISALIDSYGRVVAKVPLGTAGIIDAMLPTRLEEPTMYSDVADWWVIIVVGVLLLSVFCNHRLYKKTPKIR